MATTKTANYTAEQTAELVKAYKELPTKDTVQAFAVKFGKTEKSVVAKLSREGVYQKKEYTSKTGGKPVAKEALADALGIMAGLSEAETDSLAKVNKTGLVKLLNLVSALQAKTVKVEDLTEDQKAA